jgi:hypothetical protein
MNAQKWFVLTAAAVALGLAPCLASPAQASPRQYYSRYWQKHGSYYYRDYYYKPAQGSREYHSHYVIYYPSRPRYYYYYAPSRQKYWGRYDRQDGTYAALKTDDQKGAIADIPADAFPQGGKMPAIPESEDGTPMDPPPDGLPPDESNGLGADALKEKMPSLGKNDPPRQVYSDWCQNGGYYYCTYYCQPKAGGDYSCHRCIYYPAQPKYVYYYNPVSKKYWGRFDVDAAGYSLLEEKDRAALLADVPDSAFPKPGPMPMIPGSKDGPAMDRPPKELPE